MALTLQGYKNKYTCVIILLWTSQLIHMGFGMLLINLILPELVVTQHDMIILPGRLRQPQLAIMWNKENNKKKDEKQSFRLLARLANEA